MIFFACAILTAAALIFTLYVRPEHLPAEPLTEPEMEYLAEKKKVVYENLRDLHLEYRMGKLSETDYAQLKAHFQAELAGVMRDMDAQAARRDLTKPAGAPSAGTCPHCAGQNPADHRFCGHCGAPLTPSASS